MLKIKEYLTIEELITNMKSKGIIMSDENIVKEILEYNNYYYITGYKCAFKKADGSYKDNTSFEDIYLLYLFDKKLKLILLEVLLEIEQKVKTVFINNFCKTYGYTEFDLKNPNNYDLNNKYLNTMLLNMANQMNLFGNKNLAVSYYLQNYKETPIWVYSKVLTFGLIKDAISCSTNGTKTYVTKKIVNNKTLKANDILNMLELLNNTRNMCCHDDMVMAYVHRKTSIKTTDYHKQFNLLKDNKGQYLQGKKDLFACIISIKYFIDKDKYKKFIHNIYNLIDEYSNKINVISRKELLYTMHLPNNFEKIAEL